MARGAVSCAHVYFWSWRVSGRTSSGCSSWEISAGTSGRREWTQSTTRDGVEARETSRPLTVLARRRLHHPRRGLHLMHAHILVAACPRLIFGM